MVSSISTKISGGSDAASNQIFTPKQQADELHPVDLTAQYIAKPIFTKKSSDSSIAEMPNEVKYHILFSLAQKLPPKEAVKEILKMSLMSKNWKDVSRVVLTDLINKRKLSLSDIGIDTADKALCFLKIHGKNLKHLDLNGFMTDSVAIATAIAEGCKKLTNLSFFVSHYGQTEEATIIVAEGLKNLQSLNLRAQGGLTDKAVIAIARNLKDLTSLTLSHGGECSSDVGIRAIAEGLKKLTSLELPGGWDWNEGAGMAIAEGLKNLTRLSFSRSLRLTDGAMIAVAKGCKNLESLDVSGCSRLTSAAIIAIAENCTNLKQLDISHNRHITEEVAATIGGGLTNLIDLDLFLCRNLSDTALIAIVEGCENLENLNLECCEMITDRAVIAIAERCKKLKTLNLRNCFKLTKASSTAIARGLKNLTSLDLQGCERIIDNTERIMAIALSAIPVMMFDMSSSYTWPRIFTAVAGGVISNSLGISESTVHVAATIGLGMATGIVIEKYDLSFGLTRDLARNIKKFASVDYSLFWSLIRGELGNDTDMLENFPDFYPRPAFRWIR